MATNLRYEEVEEFFNFPKMLPHQRSFATTKARFPLGIGAQGSGKSLAGICRTIFLCIETPYFGKCFPNRGIVGRYSRTDLIPTTMKDFMEMLPSSWIKREPVRPFFELILINDSQIQFMPVEDLGRFKSANLGFSFLEEVDEIGEREFEELAFNRMRRKTLLDGDILPFRSCFQVCNPTPFEHWVYQLWGKNEEKLLSKSDEEQRKFDPEYLVIHSSTYDNEENLPKDYITEREKHFGGRNSKRGRIYLMGEWGGMDEQIYWMFSDDLINDEDVWPPLEDQTLVCIDHAWGVNGKIAVDFISVHENDIGRSELLVYDSLTLKDVDVAEVVRAIDEALQFHALMRARSESYWTPSVQRVPIWAAPHDPAMKMQLQRTESSQEKTSVAEVYQQRAFERGFALPMIPGNNAVEPGIDRGQWLMTNKLIRFNPRCGPTISALRNAVWDPDQPGKQKNKQKDHCDSCRYGWMFLNPMHHFPIEKKKLSLIEEIVMKRERARIRSLREMVL